MKVSEFHRIRAISLGILCLWGFVCFSACVSHLQEAKYYYAKGEELSRAYQNDLALAAYKRSLLEAKLEIEHHPSAQAYMLKGLAELNLELWKDAEKSLLHAFAFGFEKGEEWAEHLALFGLARTLREMGLESSAARVFYHLLDRVKLKPISRLAVQQYMDYTLNLALDKTEKERSKLLANLLKTVEKLTAKDMSYGYYHYLESQILSHQTRYRMSFEKAVIAKELGLPSQEVSRDNDNQIIFCYQSLYKELSAEEWEHFQAHYLKWIEKWGWSGPEIPDWKKR